MKTAFLGIFAAGVVGAALSLSACSSDASKSGDGGGTGGAGTGGTSGSDAGACTGGPEKAATPDAHCVAPDGGAIKQATGACDTSAEPASDAGAAGADYGDTMQGTEGDDDDCKYHVSFTVTPVCSVDGSTFTVTVTNTTTGKPVTGAAARIEATLADDSAIAKNTGTTTEKAGGVYEIGPVKFGHSGKWVVRFHFFEQCSDAPEDSPHGHAAFYVDVP
jgi:hypothetical protein